MTLANMIPHRRSVRAYRAEAIAAATLADLRAYMDALVPLIPGAKVEGRIIPTSHGTFIQKWKTPHFIVIFSEPTDDGLINAGFMFQQLGVNVLGQMRDYVTNNRTDFMSKMAASAKSWGNAVTKIAGTFADAES